jgi:hypothetical protein
MRSNGVLVVVTLRDTGKYLVAQVGVINKAAVPLDVLPQSFSMMVLKPNPKKLRYLPPEKVIRSINNSAAWSNFFTALGAATATQQSVTQSTTNGTASAYGTGGAAYGRFSASTTSVTTIPDQQAQQDAANRIAANNASVAAASQEVSYGSFQSTTVTPGKSVSGNLYFEHARKLEELEVQIPVNGDVFDFDFDWKLSPMRAARLDSEFQFAAEAARAEQDRQEQERLRQQREDEAAQGYWTDPDTGLQWADMADKFDVNRHDAAVYCSTLRLNGHNDWRLPTIQELQDIYVSTANSGSHAKGDMRISGLHWSSTIGPNGDDTWLENVDDGQREATNDDVFFGRAICVRRSLGE